MYRQLAQCPYCHQCEIAVDDHPQLVFNPGKEANAPCAHLAWLEGRFSEFERREHGIQHLIGSLEMHWESPHPDLQFSRELESYLKELVNKGPKWAFAPRCGFELKLLSAEEISGKGKEGQLCEVDGWAIFAEDPQAFWAALPACCNDHLASLEPPDENVV